MSSGAIALGQNYLKVKKKKLKIEMSQALASIGQIHLTNIYRKMFEKNKIKIGQILISPDDTEKRRRAINIKIISSLKIWIRSKCDSVEKLDLTIDSSSTQLLKGKIKGIFLYFVYF